mgnify:CR=1 FL=1
MVYVDDFLFILPEGEATTLTTAVLLTLTAIGCPLSWKKTAYNNPNTWLGFLINSHTLTARLTPQKHTDITHILQKVAQ